MIVTCLFRLYDRNHSRDPKTHVCDWPHGLAAFCPVTITGGAWEEVDVQYPVAHKEVKQVKEKVMRADTQQRQAVTTDHILIRQMVEGCPGHPAIQIDDSCSPHVDKLSFYFETSKSAVKLWPISWKTFFVLFDTYRSVLVYDPLAKLTSGTWYMIKSVTS